MKSVLLIFDDLKELEFIEHNLSESGFIVFKAINLEIGLAMAQEFSPCLIVINTSYPLKDIDRFSKQLKISSLKDMLLLCLIELEDYLFSPSKKHLVIKPVRPKLLLSLIRGIMNNEEITWLLNVH